jgi:putative cell wall-binding protein
MRARTVTRVSAIVLAAVLGASVFTVTGGSGQLPPASAASELPIPSRIHGVDRYDQAIRVSRSGFARADTVYIASGQKFADALSAGAVAGAHDSPLLLTPASALPVGLIAELNRLSPTKVVVVGGPASVSDDVLAQLSHGVSGAIFLRVGGADRYEVSRTLVTDPVVGVPKANVVMLATGQNFPDALAAAPATVRVGGSLILVDGSRNELPRATSNAIVAYGGESAVIVGGPASVSSGIESELSALPRAVLRIEGTDRYEVPVNLNSRIFSPTQPERIAYLASGATFPDALSGGPLAGGQDAPIYLVRETCVPAGVLTDLHRFQPTKIVLLGGPASLGAGVESLASC